MNKTIVQFLYSARLGDGCFYRRNEKQNYLFTFTSYNNEYINFVYNYFKSLEYSPYPIRDILSGFKVGSKGYTFQTRVHTDFTYVASLTVSECVNALDVEGLAFFYLDDGSYHKNKHFGHLYCNTFSVDDVNALIEKFYSLYPIKRCSLRWDRKKNGKCYPYIYIPVSVMNEFKKDVKVIIDKYDLHSFDYKVGLPSQTIERR